jgi:signal transduction histidine kinase
MRVLLKNPDTQKAPEIDCDRSKMGQLFSNLLGNAIM